MDYKKISNAIRLCGSQTDVQKCKENCPYFVDEDMSNCIPVMTKDAADVIDELQNIIEDAKKSIKSIDISIDFKGNAYPCNNTTKQSVYNYARRTAFILSDLNQKFISEYRKNKKLLDNGLITEYTQELKDYANMIAANISYRSWKNGVASYETGGLFTVKLAFKILGWTDPHFEKCDEQN